jgi:mannan polymerase II complex MNN10 subunit
VSQDDWLTLCVSCSLCATTAPSHPYVTTTTHNMPSFQSPPMSPADGWSSPGLETNSGGTTPVSAYPTFDRSGRWESSRVRSKGQTFLAHNQGFFTRNMRRISSGLPTFNSSADSYYVEKDKHVFRPRSAWQRLPLAGRIRRCAVVVGRRSKPRLLLILLLALFMFVLFMTRTSVLSILNLGEHDGPG